MKVIIAEGNVGVRGMMKSAVEACGVKDVIVLASLPEVMDHLHPESPESTWLIAGPALDQPVNIWQVLAHCAENPNLSEFRISLVLPEKMPQHLQLAFELGLFSADHLPLTVEGMTSRFKDLYTVILESPELDYQVSADDLKDCLIDSEEFDKLMKFEQRLVNHFPRNPHLLLGLAEAKFLCGQKDEAIQIVSKARFLGDDMQRKAAEVLTLIEPEKKLSDLGSFADAFGVEQAMVIDPDSVEAARSQGILENLGVPEVDRFEKADDAYQVTLSEEYSVELIVTEWKNRGLSVPAFLQRLENRMKRLPPVIVVSSKVKEADAILLQEMGVSAILEKPYQDEEMVHAFFNAIKSNDQPTQVKELMHKLKQAVFEGERSSAKEAHVALLQWPKLSEGDKATANALWHYIEKDYLAAKDQLLIALKELNNNILLIDLLGKVLLRLNQHDAAIQCFMKATHLSPLNLERLCTTAEVCSESGQGDNAQEMLSSAKKVDADSERVVLAESRVAINLGDTEAAQNAVSRMGNLSQLIGYMNNRAITMVHDGEVEPALTLYDDALKSLPADRGRERSVVLFNKGIALARLQKVDEAIAEFSKITAEDNADIHKKAGGLSRKIKAMADAGKEISFSSKGEAVDLMLGRPQSLYAIPGQLRLHLIFESEQFIGDELNKILKPLPELKKASGE